MPFDRPRIAVLGTRGIPARYGGFETFAEELSLRLAARGVEVTVYGETGCGTEPDAYKGIRLVHIPAPRLGPLTTILFDIRCLWHARKGYHVVYMLGYGAAFFCFFPRLWGSQVWINMDGVEWARSKWSRFAKIYFRLMERIAVRTANRVIADAYGIEAFLRARHKKMPPCTVIPYGAEVVEHAPRNRILEAWSIEPHQYYLVVCRLEPENHVLEILQGYVTSKAAYPLIIVGDHKAGTRYVEQLKTVKDARIRFIGTVYDKQALQQLRYFCRAYLHGHSVGGTNPSLLEALGCGNLVIAHDNEFNREVIRDSGFFFKDSHDVRSLIEKIQLLKDADCAVIATRARNRIRESYTWETITESYYTLLA